ncbi:MAG: UDP-N-acetylmuramate dehydrogenase [Clostridia bacterium]
MNITANKLKTLLVEGTFLENESLKKYSSLHIGGKARYFVLPRNTCELTNIVAFAKTNKISYFVLGNGSNVLFSDKGYRGIVICLKQMERNFAVCGETAKIGAGASLSYLASKLSNNGFTGLEWAVQIPASVGGAIQTNAGAFGSDIASILLAVTIFDGSNIIKIERKDIEFSYRKCSLSGKGFIILEAEFSIKPCDVNVSKSRVVELIEIRNASQPKGFSAGCSFLKAGEYSAGALIEKAGLKGKRIGGAYISSLHANFIINDKNAKSRHIEKLLKICEKQVYNKFGVKLVREIEKIGD